MREPAMARSYYSTVLNHTADGVWAVIRLFDHYAWAGVESDTVIEEGKRGDQVSAVRRVTMGERVIRQILLGHSDLDRAYTYAFFDPAALPVTNPTSPPFACCRWSTTTRRSSSGRRRWIAQPTSTTAGRAITSRRGFPNGWPRCAASWPGTTLTAMSGVKRQQVQCRKFVPQRVRAREVNAMHTEIGGGGGSSILIYQILPLIALLLI